MRIANICVAFFFLCYMGYWGNLFNAATGRTFKITDKLPADIKFFYNNGELLWDKCNDSDSMKSVYERCAPVSSIVDSMADSFVNAEIGCYNARTNKRVRGEQNKQWQKLIDNPNWMQDGIQFFRQLYSYRKMFGYCYVLKMKAAGFDSPTSLWVLPNWLLEIEYKETGLYLTDKNINRKVYLKWNDSKILLNSEDLILFTDTTNLFNQETYLPLPRIYTKQYSLTLLISILEAETTLIQNKGALGIISSDQQAQGISIPLSKDQKSDLQAQWSQYGLSRDKWQMMFTNAGIKYTPLVFDAGQLQLKEGYLNAIKDLCDGLHYPFILTAHSDQSTYNNRKEATKDLYQEAIIPDAKSIAKTLAQGLGLDKMNITIELDYEHIEALQENKKNTSDALRSMNIACKTMWDNGIITLNRWRELADEEPETNPLFSKYKFELTPEELSILNMMGYGNNNQANGGQGSNTGNQNNQGNSNQN